MIHRLKLLLGALLLIFIVVILYFCKKSNLEVVKTINQNEDYIVYEHPENWRINDINTYAYMIHDILNPFNDDILEDGLWITDNFKKKYENSEFSLRVSINSDIFNEWYRTNIETGEDTSLIDNTQQGLDKGNIILYTEIHDASVLQEKKYTLKFTVDNDNRLDDLEIEDTEIVKDYNGLTYDNLELFKLILQDVNSKDIVDLSNYCDNVILNKDFDFSHLKFINDNMKLLEIKFNNNYSEYNRLLYDIKVENDGLIEYYGFAILLDYNDKVITKAYIDFNSSWGKETEEQYYNMDTKIESDW